MQTTFKEKAGNRIFERLGRWNAIDYTIITRKNINAPYADDNGGDKLWLTYFKPRGVVMPLNKFKNLDNKLSLEDHITLSLYDSEDGLYGEMNSDNTKIRIYKEVI